MSKGKKQTSQKKSKANYRQTEDNKKFEKTSQYNHDIRKKQDKELDNSNSAFDDFGYRGRTDHWEEDYAD